MPFDPSQPFEIVEQPVDSQSSAPPRFDPDQPFEVVEPGKTPRFDPDASFEVVEEPTPSLRYEPPRLGLSGLPVRPFTPTPAQISGGLADQSSQMTEQNAEQRERSMLTPDERGRLEPGGVVDTAEALLMHSPPGTAVPDVTVQELQQAFPALPPAAAKVLSGILKTTTPAINFATQPAGAAMVASGGLAAAGGIAGAAGMASLATIGLDMIKAVPESVANFIEAFDSGDLEHIAQASTQLGMVIAGGTGAARGVVGGLEGIAATEAAVTAAKVKHAGLDESAAALDQLARQVKEAPLDAPTALQAATEAGRPLSTDLLSTPEALRRSNELQMAERVSPVTPEGMVEPTASRRPFLSRSMEVELTDAAAMAIENMKLANERKAERSAGGKLDRGGQAFSGQEAAPGVARSADQSIAQRSPPEPTTVRDIPELSETTPLRDAEQIVRERLEQRDLVNAVAALGQLKAEVSRKVIDKLLGTGREAVPLSVAERTIFNEVWDRALEQTGHKPPTPPAESPWVQRLESLKTPLEPGVGSNPFPQIARAVWNTSLDIAIAAVKAGGHVKNAIEEAIAHLKKNASGFDEASVRKHLERIIKSEAQIEAGRNAASEVADRPVVSTPKAVTDPKAPEWKKPLRPLGELYSEPLNEKLRRVGGKVSAVVAEENMGIIARAKNILGELKDAFLEKAQTVAGKNTPATRWMNGIREYSPQGAISRLHDVIETAVVKGNLDHVPAEFRDYARLLWDANFAGIGRLAEKASPAFKAIGKVQRILTDYGFDIVKRGSGKAWETFAKELADANSKPVEGKTGTKAFLRRWKAELDKPGSDATHLDRIAQDFTRQFPNAVTHIRPVKGLGWQEVLVSEPFRYLEQAGQRTANAVAFREVYPLIEHEGKWVSSGKLEATRKAALAEINTSKHEKAFDNAFKALQGHPLDTFTSGWTAPGTVGGVVSSFAGEVLKPALALKLTASLPVNIPETLYGGAAMFLGIGNAFKGMTKFQQFAQLRRLGILSKTLRDFSWNPTQPGRSASRIITNTIHRYFGTDILNEFQEFTGGSAARIVANEIRAGTLPEGSVQEVVAAMRMMGIPRERALAAVAGNDAAAVNMFETKAAESLSGGNQVTAEMSRWGASRAFNELFRFQRYSMMKVRQLRGVANNLIEDYQMRDMPQAWANVKNLGKYTGGTILGGALSIGIMRTLYEGFFGTEILSNEAKDDWLEFLGQSAIQGVGGPVAVFSRMAEKGLGVDTAISGIVDASPSIGLAREMTDAVLGRGRYEGNNSVEAVGTFLRSNTPAFKALKQGMAAWGLSQDDTELDSSLKALGRWKRDKYGFVKVESFLEPEFDTKRFRYHMKRAVEALKDGKDDDYDTEVELAMSAEDPVKADATPKELKKSVQSSLRGQMVLKNAKGAALNDDELDELRARIGDKAVEKLLDFDAMLKAEARR